MKKNRSRYTVNRITRTAPIILDCTHIDSEFSPSEIEFPQTES